MVEDPEYVNDDNEVPERRTGGFNKVLAILFVLAIYMVIFLKILFLK